MSFLPLSNPPHSTKQKTFGFAGVNYTESRSENECSDCKNIITEDLPAITVRGSMYRHFPYSKMNDRILRFVRTHDSLIELNTDCKYKNYLYEHFYSGEEKIYVLNDENAQYIHKTVMPIKYKDAVVFSYRDTTAHKVMLCVPGERAADTVTYAITDSMHNMPDSYLVAFGNRILCAYGDAVHICYEDNIGVWDQYYVEGSAQGSYDVNEAVCQQIPLSTGGKFTGCTYFKDKPILFKEQAMYALYGNYAPFSLVKIADVGCRAANTIQIIGDTLYFLSADGVMAYSGGTPYCISDKVPQLKTTAANGCTASNRYYFIDHYVYDTKYKCWSCLDEAYRPMFAYIDRVFFYHPVEQTIEEMQQEILPNGERVEWHFTSGTFHERDTAKKLYTGVKLRIEPLQDADVQIEVAQDGGAFEPCWNAVILRGCDRTIPLHLKPCGSFKLRISGKGRVRIPFITRTYRTVHGDGN